MRKFNLEIYNFYDKRVRQQTSAGKVMLIGFCFITKELFINILSLQR